MKKVYYIQEGSNIIGKGRIKIGASSRPFERLKALQIGNPDPLYLISVGHYGETEQERHDHYAAYRIGNSEWFWPGEKLVAYLVSGGQFPDWRGWDDDWDDSEFVPRATEQMVRDEIDQWHEQKTYWDEHPEEWDL